MTDELTGLSNRRRFQEAMATEVERSRRFGQPVGLVMLDIDDFKAVNDTYGHQQGDLVLREVARVLRETSREIDEPARYGGEELAVVLPGTDLEGAYNLAERVRAGIEELRAAAARRRRRSLRVTASFGVATLPGSADGHARRWSRRPTRRSTGPSAAGKNRTVRAEPRPSCSGGAVARVCGAMGLLDDAIRSTSSSSAATARIPARSPAWSTRRSGPPGASPCAEAIAATSRSCADGGRRDRRARRRSRARGSSTTDATDEVPAERAPRRAGPAASSPSPTAEPDGRASTRAARAALRSRSSSRPREPRRSRAPTPPSRDRQLDRGAQPDRARRSRDADVVPADEEPEGDDVLEETPEFLQETPEHDRLWFEQKPPRDFDF